MRLSAAIMDARNGYPKNDGVFLVFVNKTPSKPSNGQWMIAYYYCNDDPWDDDDDAPQGYFYQQGTDTQLDLSAVTHWCKMDMPPPR